MELVSKSNPTRMRLPTVLFDENERDKELLAADEAFATI